MPGAAVAAAGRPLHAVLASQFIFKFLFELETHTTSNFCDMQTANA